MSPDTIKIYIRFLSGRLFEAEVKNDERVTKVVESNENPTYLITDIDHAAVSVLTQDVSIGAGISGRWGGADGTVDRIFINPAMVESYGLVHPEV